MRFRHCRPVNAFSAVFTANSPTCPATPITSFWNVVVAIGPVTISFEIVAGSVKRSIHTWFWSVACVSVVRNSVLSMPLFRMKFRISERSAA